MQLAGTEACFLPNVALPFNLDVQRPSLCSLQLGLCRTLRRFTGNLRRVCFSFTSVSREPELGALVFHNLHCKRQLRPNSWIVLSKQISTELRAVEAPTCRR